MRKIETIKQLQSLGLKTAEVKEFRAEEINEMIIYAKELINKYGSFNLRTDTANGQNNYNLPFIRQCTIEGLKKLVNERGEEITYLVHQDIPVENQLFNGVLRLCENQIIGEINEFDKTSLRQAMKYSKNLKRIRTIGKEGIFNKIKNDLSKVSSEVWVELSAYEDGSIIYWQLVNEEMNDKIKELFLR